MSGSPSPSPRRMPRLRPVSPLAALHHYDNDEGERSVADAAAAAAARVQRSDSQARGSDHHGQFYHISLSDGPATNAARPAADPPQTSARAHGYSHSHAYDISSSRRIAASPSRLGNSSISSISSIGDAHRPVQEYHNGFANASDPFEGLLPPGHSLPPPPSATSPTSPTASHFATLSSASRAFLEHRRQQSIPNLLPSISTIGRNLGRAISPDRSLRPLQSTWASKSPAPEQKYSRSRDRYGGNSDNNNNDDDDDSASSSDYSSDDDDSDDTNDRRTMAPFTNDTGASRQAHTYTTYKGSRNQTDSPSLTNNFSNWLSGGSTGADASNRTPRTGMHSPTARRSISSVSELSATPRSVAVGAASSTSPSRFSQLATSMTATLSRLTQQSPVSPRRGVGGDMTAFDKDDFFNMDVDAALFPAGQPSDRDAFSPAAYKNLQANATGAFRRIQAAYRQRMVTLRDLAAEKSVCDEELEEAETRVQHFKMQLEGMARQAAEQKKEMQALMDELAAEKMARAQERAMLLSGVPATPTAAAISAGAGGPLRDRDDDHAASTILSEDLGVDEAQRSQKRRKAWRRRSLKSDGSSLDDTDEGEEESAVDEDESSSSVFSRSRSPTFTPSINFSLESGAAGGGDAGHPHVPHPRVAALGSARPHRSLSSSTTSTVVSQQQQQPLSTFQKLMKNVTAAIKDEDPTDGPGGGTSNCRNCRGQDVSFAWNTVSVLRDENKHLKQRVGQLEVAVEGALDMVNGVGLD